MCLGEQAPDHGHEPVWEVQQEGHFVEKYRVEPVPDLRQPGAQARKVGHGADQAHGRHRAEGQRNDELGVGGGLAVISLGMT